MTEAVITAVAATSAFGRGVDALAAAAWSGIAAFGPVQRFDVRRRRVGVAATMPGAPKLLDELLEVVREVVGGLDPADRSTVPLLLAGHAHPDLASAPGAPPTLESLAADLAAATGLSDQVRAYTSACVASSTAVADAAAIVTKGRADRVVVAAGYVVEPDQFALFDAGRALATDGRVRPFSAGRTGLLLGDGVAAIVVESAAVARARGATVLARLAGWGRTGDAYHVIRPRPDGAGLARAIAVALSRGRVAAGAVGYVNAHGSGTAHSDAAESAALARALGRHAAVVPVSSTKAVHGQALEASGMLELIITIQSLRDGALPVNAGFVEADPACQPLNLVLSPARSTPEYALSVNCAFGGANTALLVGAPC
jgi:3-oxoacyl-(acyl-carrier-protein) synthase